MSLKNESEVPRSRYPLAVGDWLLLGTLLPVCLFGFVMTIVHGVHGDFVVPVFGVWSAPDRQSYPMVHRVQPLLGADPNALTVGDRLLRLEEADLRGVSMAGFMLHWSRAAQAGVRSLRLTIERGSAQLEVRAPLVPGFILPGTRWWAPLPVIGGLLGAALLLLVRATHWQLARRHYVASLLWVIWCTPYFSAPTAPRCGIIIRILVLPIACALTVWNANEFVSGLRLWSRAQRTVTWSLALLLAAASAGVLWLPHAGLTATFASWGELALPALIVAILVAFARVYQRADPLGRRQIKWIVYGFYVGMLPVFFLSVGLSLRVAAWAFNTLFAIAAIAAVAIPLGVLFAVVFYQFLDIDRLFSATLSYSVLTILGVALVLGVMPSASQAASEALGLAPIQGQMLFALGLAAVVVPAQRVVGPRIDRWFFPQRLVLEQGFAHLLATLSRCGEMQQLMRLVDERLEALLQPAAAVVYARAQPSDDVFTPLAVRGRTAPPAFAAQSTLIATLQGRTEPLVAERWTARRSLSLTPFERAALETLAVALLLPFHRGPDLIAFSCLGPKRSGDIYTPTDLAWLGAVAGRVSDRLLALDATALTEQARAMQEALRRYVPGAVATRLASGQDIEPGEREVTVLFVDIRGSTSFSEARQATEIFHTVNSYTEMVSQTVGARGGSVVEFHGDGLLAVFGAPDDIAMKERAAVQVGCEIVASMAALSAAAEIGTAKLSVGVGIGTGPAFVGNIQSSDRFIWTVIGDTVNLAARLQSMTRELNAAVAIDDTTYRRAGDDTCAAFLHHADLPIRGRLQPETVHTLPL